MSPYRLKFAEIAVEPVRRYVDRRGELAEESTAPRTDESVGAEGEMPIFATRDAVAGRHIKGIAVERDHESMRTFHLRRLLSDRDGLFDGEAFGAQAEAMN